MTHLPLSSEDFGSNRPDSHLKWETGSCKWPQIASGGIMTGYGTTASPKSKCAWKSERLQELRVYIKTQMAEKNRKSQNLEWIWWGGVYAFILMSEHFMLCAQKVKQSSLFRNDKIFRMTRVDLEIKVRFWLDSDAWNLRKATKGFYRCVWVLSDWFKSRPLETGRHFKVTGCGTQSNTTKPLWIIKIQNN